jgi:RNA polymerase sigma-70 factor (ECF subfamily)
MPDDLDGDLLARFVHGDRDAFERIFRQYEREVYRWILRIVGERSAAEDAVVEAFWRAHRSRARFDPSRSFGAWMRRIATNAALDQVKASRQRGWVSFDSVGRVPPSTGAAGRGGPADTVADSIQRAFRALPPKLQVVARLALIEERPHAEIADALNVPIGTVKSRLFRATRLLRKELARAGVHT